MARTLLAADWVLPITSAPLHSGAVLVEGEEIAAVGGQQELRASHPDASLRLFSRGILLPGLINLHTHLDYTLLRGYRDDETLIPWIRGLIEFNRQASVADWLESARLGVAEAVQSGITCIVDTTRTGASIPAVQKAGLRGIILLEVFGLEEASADGSFREALVRLEGHLKREGALLRLGLAPHSPYTASGTLIQRIADWSRAQQRLFCIHLAESEAEVHFLADGSGPLAEPGGPTSVWPDLVWRPPGLSPVRYLQELGVLGSSLIAAHCVQVAESELLELARSGTVVAHCPKSNAKLANGLAPLQEMLDMGVKVGLGSDSVASNNILDLFEEMRFALLASRASHRKIGLRAADMLRLVTQGSAEALGLGSVVGSLEVGKKADLIVVQPSQPPREPITDPHSTLVYTVHQGDVVLTMVNGRILYEAA